MMNLLESVPKRRRSASAIPSVALHTVLILCAVCTTAKAGPPVVDGPGERMTYLPIARSDPKPPAASARPQRINSARSPAASRQIIDVRVSLDIPDVIPAFDPGARPLDPDLIFGRSGDIKDSPPPVGDIGDGGADTAALTAIQVDREVRIISGTSRPQYPAAMRAAGIEGAVSAQFVVDETGKVDRATFAIVRATSDLFAKAVRDAVGAMRFEPAMLGSKPVRQIVSQTFIFKLDR